MDATGKNGKSKEASPLLGKYEVGRFLGRGNFAKVYHARSVSDGAEVAVKVIDKPALLRADMAECVLREVTAMRRLRHPHVLRIHEVLATRSKIYLVMEYASGGDLMARLAALRPGRHFAESMVRRSFMQLAAGLIYCHARGVAHRDIKPHNVLLDADGNVKVADFGLAALSDSLHADGCLHTKCGTPGFVAPEILCHQAYDGAKADAWSCGVILFILLTGRLPFDDLNNVNMLRKVLRREYTFPEWVSQSARRLIHRLLDPNPKTRLAVAELVNHPWFKRSFSLDSQLGGLLDGTLERALEFQAPALTAFDIITMSPGLDLSGLFGIRRTDRQKRFITTASPEQTLERLDRAGVKLGYVLVGKKGVGSLPIRGIWGLAAMSVEISEVSPPLMLVEMRLETVDGDGGGEGEEFGWEELRVELGDVVRTWHSCQDL